MTLPSGLRRIGLRRIGLNVISSAFWMLFGVLPQARAANVQVACPGGGPGVFPSIHAALSSMNPNDANVITVSGTCVENIFIAHFTSLLIQPVAGQVAAITAA